MFASCVQLLNGEREREKDECVDEYAGPDDKVNRIVIERDQPQYPLPSTARRTLNFAKTGRGYKFQLVYTRTSPDKTPSLLLRVKVTFIPFSILRCAIIIHSSIQFTLLYSILRHLYGFLFHSSPSPRHSTLPFPQLLWISSSGAVELRLIPLTLHLLSYLPPFFFRSASLQFTPSPSILCLRVPSFLSPLQQNSTETGKKKWACQKRKKWRRCFCILFAKPNAQKSEGQL